LHLNQLQCCKDRLKESRSEIEDDIEDFAFASKYQPFDDKSVKLGKVILLMHERAFRYRLDDQNQKTYPDTQKLKRLIINLKKKGFSFETINKY